MLKRIVDIVYKAGEIYRGAGSDLSVSLKTSNVDLVTKYDKEIHERIVDLIGIDQVWDDENGRSNIHQNIKIENLIPMDILIIE